MDAKILESKKIEAEEQKKKKIQMIMLGVLLLVFVVILFSTLTGGKKPPAPVITTKPPVAVVPPSPPPVALPPATPPAASVNTATPQPAEDVSAAAPDNAAGAEADEWGASPFSIQKEEEKEEVEQAPVEEPPTPLELKGIVSGPGDSSFAIINEKIVKKGDRIADNTVREITSDEVVLQTDEGEEVVLKNN